MPSGQDLGRAVTRTRSDRRDRYGGLRAGAYLGSVSTFAGLRGQAGKSRDGVGRPLALPLPGPSLAAQPVRAEEDGGTVIPLNGALSKRVDRFRGSPIRSISDGSPGEHRYDGRFRSHCVADFIFLTAILLGRVGSASASGTSVRESEAARSFLRRVSALSSLLQGPTMDVGC